MSFKHIPDRIGLNDDLAAFLSTSMAPFMSEVSKAMGIGGLENPDEAQFAIPMSSMTQDVKATEKPLCTACSSITDEALHGSERFMHSKSLSHLCESAKNCALCNIMRLKLWEEMVWSSSECTDSPTANFTNEQLVEGLRKLASERGSTWPDSAPIFLRSDGSNSGGYEHVMMFTFVARLEPRNDGAYNVWYQGFTLGKLLRHDGKGDKARPLLPRGDDKSTLRRMRTWLEGCDTDLHSWSDRLTQNNTRLPTRVLDLGCKDDSNSLDSISHLRLLETKGMMGRYATLSYCWGGYTDCRTLKSNLDQHCTEMHYEKLPKMFQQAVTVTRGLGIQYLWIDALCIVQDDAEDWKFEASRMADVYWNGVCRLAITNCQNPTEGFFPPKDIVSSVRIPSLEPKLDQVEESSASSEGSSEWETEDDEAGEVVQSSQNLGDRSFSKHQETSMSTSREEVSNDGEKAPVITTPHSPTTGGGSHSRASLEKPDQSKDKRPSDNGHFKPQDESFQRFMDEEDRKWQQAIDEAGAKYAANEKKEDKHWNVYFSLPKSYERDVDFGHLNTRGWVLQERLLSPRTIHFTPNHIYFENEDDICGEDFARKQFTWLSCVKKASKSSRSLLFPEDSIVQLDIGDCPENSRAKELWLQRGMFGQGNYRHMTDSSHSWLKIAESFSQCNFTYMTDKVVAIAGLVKRKQVTKDSSYFGSLNLFGLWEKTLHIDLAWLAAGARRLVHLPDLKLPSWSWLAYNGSITFTQDRRNIRDASTVQRPPTSEIRLIHINTPDLPDVTQPLPLGDEASLTMAVRLRPLSSTSMKTMYGLLDSCDTRSKLATALPYIHFDSRTGTIPILLSELTDTQQLFDQEDKLVGCVSFDQNERLTTGSLFCAHVSTLRDECSHAAREEMEKKGLTEYTIPCPPILAYALVLKRVDGREGAYARVGLAEVGYEWMMAGVEEEVKLL